MSEIKYQRKVITKLEKEGWLVLRLRSVSSSISANGIPDLLALKPDSDSGKFDVKFIEVKSETGRTSKIQDYVIKKLREMGFDVVVDRPDKK